MIYLKSKNGYSFINSTFEKIEAERLEIQKVNKENEKVKGYKPVIYKSPIPDDSVITTEEDFNNYRISIREENSKRIKAKKDEAIKLIEKTGLSSKEAQKVVELLS